MSTCYWFRSPTIDLLVSSLVIGLKCSSVVRSGITKKIKSGISEAHLRCTRNWIMYGIAYKTLVVKLNAEAHRKMQKQKPISCSKFANALDSSNYWGQLLDNTDARSLMIASQMYLSFTVNLGNSFMTDNVHSR